MAFSRLFILYWGGGGGGVGVGGVRVVVVVVVEGVLNTLARS